MNEPTNKAIGKPLDRVDGRLKVTGAARYAAEFPLKNIAHAVLVQSAIAKGRIQSIDTSAAQKSPGVLAVITHLNAPKLASPQSGSGDSSTGDAQVTAANAQSGEGGNAGGENPFEKPVPVLQSDKINFYGQHIGVVVAETLEQARHAATLLRVTYREERPATVMEANLANAYKPQSLLVPLKPDTQRGDLKSGLSAADVRVDHTYTTPNEHHQPMEAHATTAVWDGQQLTLYDASQNVNGVQKTVANTLRIPPENIRVISSFVGGGFGSKYPVRGHTILAAIAAQQVKRPVKLVVTREQMFTSVGFRSHSSQRIRLGAKRDGKLTAVSHEIHTQTSVFEEFIEHVGVATPMLYDSPNLLVTHRGVRLNLPTPTIMRAPGESPGMFAFESAMDELAYALKLDPIELRLRNEPERDPEKGLPWSSRSLVESFRQGAKSFGWERRNPEPRSMRDGRYLIGMGTATATYPTNRMPSSAKVRMLADGSAIVFLAATDIGTGTYTALTQIAADTLGIPTERVRVEMGDTKMPRTPGSGGSWGAASYGSAVQAACVAVRAKILGMASQDVRSPLKNLSDADIDIREGRIFAKQDTSKGETYQEILARNNLKVSEAEVESTPDEAAKKYSMHAFGAQFAEVRVDPDLGMVRVTRFLGTYGAGRILNPKTARSQMIGGIIMGIGMALHEETVVDERYGHFVNHNLGEYHVPVHADIPAIEAFFVEENDPHVNPLGVKGVGEIGIVGVAAAVANAVYHATGKRIRDLPITPDKLL